MPGCSFGTAAMQVSRGPPGSVVSAAFACDCAATQRRKTMTSLKTRMYFSRSWSGITFVILIIHRPGIPRVAFQAAKSCWLFGTADASAVSSGLIRVRGRAISRRLRRARVVAALGTQHYFSGGSFMRYRLLGRSGLLVSEICLGTMTYGGKGRWQPIGQLGPAEVEAQVKAAFDAGVNFIDTADVYSEGDAEVLLGQALKKLKVPRQELVIATKVRVRMGPGPNQVGLSRGHIMDAVEASLRSLQLDYIDLYQIHGQDLATPLEETLRALEDLVRSGKVRYLGLSNHAAWQIMKGVATSERRGWNRFESVQAYYSLAGRDVEREIVPVALDQGLGILVWSPLAGGLLSGKLSQQEEVPEGDPRTRFDFPPGARARAFRCVDAMRPIAHAHAVSLP